MPIYDNQVILEIARGAKAFLTLRMGVTRGEVPAYQEQTRRLEQAHYRVKQQDQSIEKQSRQLDQHKERLSKQDQTIEKQKEQLDGVKERLSKQSQTIEKQKQQLDQHKEQSSQKDEQIARLQEELATARAGTDRIALPPRTLRPCGPRLQNDEAYLARAKEEADRLAKYLGLNPDSRLLDMGSGPGRLAIGILENIGDIRRYRGVDVDKASVEWGQQHITSEHPNFKFLHIDVKNRRYNPAGSEADSGFTFPFANGEFDIVALYSVFTHMLADGVRAYLKEFQRVLQPDGKILLTAFLEDGVPDVTENPEGYRNRQWKGPLHCVRYNREFFETLLDENGFRSDGYYLVWKEIVGKDGNPEFGQRGFFISRKTSSPIVV